MTQCSSLNCDITTDRNGGLLNRNKTAKTAKTAYYRLQGLRKAWSI
ncbi:hypothetical protein IQ273_09435 [Nodosilinea sp. LEGE 07298]|nr:hypothetical protein [Nodosilinea sp. LEGE 07298]MBE9109639.1 hypothetical protein [Nodosilinea sp. LEGE 07298]